MPGDLSGSALPVYIPLITDVANIQNGLRNFYYGTASAVSDEGSIEAYSIAGRIKDLRDTKLDIASPTATTQLSISHATLPKLILTRGANTTTLQNSTAANVTLTMPATTGTLALTTESTMANLATVGSSATTITLGGSTTTSYSIGTSALSTGTKTINIGAASDTIAKTINLGTGSSSSTTTVNIGTNSGGTSTVNTYGTLDHKGAATISSTLGVTGAATMSSTLSVTGALTAASLTLGAGGPIISTGSGTPSGTTNGSLYLRTGQGMESTLYIRSTTAPNWTAVRGTKWYSGTTDSPSYADAQHGDFYLNRSNGKVFQYSST